MDVISYLRRDHEEVLGMLDRLERGPDGEDVHRGDVDARAELVTRLIMAESGHEAVEEEYFWPAVRKSVPDGAALADQAIYQEQGAKNLLEQIEGLGPGDPNFEPLLAQFIDLARRHIAFEEQQVWPEVEQALDPARLDEFGEKMAQIRKPAPTRPHPHTPPTPGVLKTAGAAAARWTRPAMPPPDAVDGSCSIRGRPYA